MTVTGWIQILLYCLIIVALTPLLGAYMTRVFGGERTFLSPVLRPVELAIYKTRRHQRRQRAALRSPIRSACCCFMPAGSYSLRADARASDPAVQSGRAVGGRAGFVVQYRRQLYHQYQLAELRRRKHDVLSRADARPHPSELSVGRDRHRARCGTDPRLCAPLRAARSATSGSMSRAAHFMSCCRSACPTPCS